MPNVLLIGGSYDFYERLNSDERWSVVRATLEESTSRDVLRDPRRWHLIIDESKHYDGVQREGRALATVSTRYLGEAKRAHMIRLAPRGSETSETNEVAYTVETSGSYDLEFNQTEEPEAIHLVDFVDQFGQSFERVHLDIESYQKYARLMDFIPSRGPKPKDLPFRVLYQDYYGNPLIVLGDFRPPILYVIDPPDEATRLMTLEYLCNRTVTKLWPEVYSDLVRSSRVVALEQEREQVIAEFRERLAQIGDVIDTESRFISAFAPLTQSADDQLKLLVKRAFEEVFNCEVIDLDEGLADDEPKTLDLLVRYGDWRCFVEVRSSGNRGAHKQDMEDMDEHVPAVEAMHGSPDSKLFVYNGLYNRSAEERTDKKCSISQSFTKPRYVELR